MYSQTNCAVIWSYFVSMNVSDGSCFIIDLSKPDIREAFVACLSWDNSMTVQLHKRQASLCKIRAVELSAPTSQQETIQCTWFSRAQVLLPCTRLVRVFLLSCTSEAIVPVPFESWELMSKCTPNIFPCCVGTYIHSIPLHLTLSSGLWGRAQASSVC